MVYKFSEIRACPKCQYRMYSSAREAGEEGADFRHILPKEGCSICLKDDDDPSGEKVAEVMEKTCRQCGYNWLELCADDERNKR